MSAQDVRDTSPDELLLHEEEPQGPTQSTKAMIIKLLIALGLFLFIYFLPRPESLPVEGHRLGAILLPIVFLWVSEAIPIGVTALLATALMIIFKVTGSSQAWAPYANRTVMFVMMIIMFGVILNEVGLAKRLLFFILKFAGTKVKQLSLFLAVSSTLLSTLFHDATITIIMLFAILPLFQSMGITPQKSNNLSKFFIILIPLAASAGGFGTMLGGGRCALAVDITQRYILETTGVAMKIGFLKYAIIEFPISIFTALATWIVCWLYFRPKEKELPASVKIESMPAMSNAEKGVAAVFTTAFVLWFAGDLTGWHVSVVSALALAGFCAPGWVSFKTICDKFPWESWIVFGSGVSLGAAMLSSGLGKYLAEVCLPLLQGHSPFVTYYGIGLFGSALSSMMSNSAAVALSLPVTLPMASMMNMSVETVGLLAPMTTSFIMLVIGCPPTIIAYSTGYFSQIEFTKVAIPWCLILLAISVCAALLYWPLIGFQ
jgi:sodium-dependent dicarboxylate transporter 2/3/5